jgi:predicted RNA-binding protein (virulence factor B family)
MIRHPLLGRSAKLAIARFAPPGAYLIRAGESRGPEVLLPRQEVPAAAVVGQELDVFVCLDSSDRPVATLRTPKLELGEVTFLEVVASTSIGAFVDWGLPKQLLVPFKKQTRELRVGQREPIGLYLDSSGRLAGTMRISEMLEQRALEFQPDEWVEGEAWRSDPELGLFVIVERRFVGRVPREEPHHLARGAAARFRVTQRLPDGKLELSLRARAHEELAGDAERIVQALAGARPPRVGDDSSPEEIRRLFGISKKAFKRALGTLLKAGRVQLDREGYAVLSRR